MKYPVAIHKDKDSDFGVTVPDLPGCFSVGASIDEALSMVHEAIECHIEGLVIDNDPIPSPQAIDIHQKTGAYKDCIWEIEFNIF